MSAYTLAWIEAHAAPEHELRQRLQDALENLHRITLAFDEVGFGPEEAAEQVEADLVAWKEITNALECDRTSEAVIEVVESLQNEMTQLHEKLDTAKDELEHGRDRWKAELGTELANERHALEVELDALRTRLRELEAGHTPTEPPTPIAVAIRTAPAHMGTVIHVDFRNGGAQSVVDLYNEACQIDEDPSKQAEAERLYRCALAIDPSYAVARTNLGNILFRRGQYAAAAVEYEQAIKDDPRCAEAHYNRGYIFADSGRVREALPYYLTAIKLDPRFQDAYFNCAMALEQCGDPHTAQWHWRKYLELVPTGTCADIARKHLLPDAPLPVEKTRQRARRKRVQKEGADGKG